ncbi:MAG: SH3-like domain-containing protein [Rickettsiales bacterium]|nr:SH3-like domain-containing protein [Rickettsiales bacterium]
MRFFFHSVLSLHGSRSWLLGACLLWWAFGRDVAPDIPEPTNRVRAASIKAFDSLSYLKEHGADAVIGQWRSRLENPKHPNAVAKRYMRHSFFMDGTVKIENEETANKQGKWHIENGQIIIETSYKTSRFLETYKLQNEDTLMRIYFRRFIDNKLDNEHAQDDKFIRQGSQQELAMGKVDIFQFSRSAQNFIDPNTLEVGKTYRLSQKTPIVPSYDPVSPEQAIKQIWYAKKNSQIKIIKRHKERNVMWYQVSVIGKKRGWVNSIALFGQDLK